MNSSLRRAALLLVTGVLFFAWLPHTVALENESFGLTPHPERRDGTDRRTFSIPLEPGATFEDAVRIYNRSDQTLNLVVYAADAEAAQDGTITVGFKTSRPHGVGAWIDLAREDIELAPRAEIVVTFRVRVRNAEPSPPLGAIVVENTDTGIASNAAQRLHIVMHTEPPNTSTTSVRVRPLLLRSPWIVVAMIGLVIAGGLVWVGARRSKRPKDVVLPAGEIGSETTQDASRPVIKRLGSVEAAPGTTRTAVLDRPRAARSRVRDNRPLIDDALLVEVDPGDDDEIDDFEEDAELEYEEEDVDDFDEGSDEADEEDDDDEDEDDLPPAGTAAKKPRAQKAAPVRKTTTRKASPRKPSVPKAKPKPKSKSKPKPKPKPAKRKTVRPAAKKAKPAKKAAPKNFIPLSDL
jgi:hypothetical protein